MQRTMTAGSETYVENIYIDEYSCEMVFRELVNGAETDIERVVALRSQPLHLEFHQRNAADGSRVQWDMPKSAPLRSVDAFVREASRMEGEKNQARSAMASHLTRSANAPTILSSLLLASPPRSHGVRTRWTRLDAQLSIAVGTFCEK